MLVRPVWLPDHLLPFWNATPFQTLRALIRGEAEGESWDGKVAVGCVVRNRAMLAWGWSSDLVEVCLQRHQFSCFWTDWRLRSKACLDALEDSGDQCADAAHSVLRDCPDLTEGAVFCFNPKLVKPQWASALCLKCRIGGHDFYVYI